MRKNVIKSILALTLISLSTACSPAEERHQRPEEGNQRPEEGYQRPKVWPKPTEPPPASPIYHDVEEKIPTEEEVDREVAEYNQVLETELEGALLGNDSVRRETAIAHILPGLLQVEPKRVIDLHARLKPGEPRERLCTEIAQLWASSDQAAASNWMRTLEGEERRSAATAAVTTLASWEPGAALRIADEFDLEKDEALRNLLKPLRRPLVDAATN